MANTIKFQAGHNISPAWYCSKCGALVRNDLVADILGYDKGFAFCPRCGEALDYAEHGVYEEVCVALTALGYTAPKPTLKRLDNDRYTETIGIYSMNRKTFVD